MTSPFDDIFSSLDMAKILILAKTFNGSDEQRLLRALADCYPVYVSRCRALPGYTDAALLGYVMDAVLDYARHKAPALFRAMMLERYTAGGMDAETADYFISGELTAVERGNFYTNGGKRWV
ncbi:MAG: hypothetical protein LBK66_01225 [Spirochaetaceae bacterium]|jgi:hypothetical protein|nr:hypothetical protein [Spirochaetaceae bacterium]